MPLLHQSTTSVNTAEPPRPAFVSSGGNLFRQTAQGGIRRLTPLDLALMSIAADVVWRLEARRQEG